MMNSKPFYMVAALLLSARCQALILPPHFPALTLPTNSTSSLTTTPPKEFDCHISAYSSEAPINQTAAYMNLLAAMDDIVFMPQTAPLSTWHIWSLPAYPSRVEIKTEEVRFAVWGLAYLNEALYRGEVHPMTIDMAWEGKRAGDIHIAAQSPSDNVLATESNSASMISTTGPKHEDAGVQFIATAEGDVKVQYIITHTGSRINMRNVFYTTLSVLAASAENGLDQPFIRAQDNLGFSFLATLNSKGHSLMTEADLSRTVAFVARKMVADDEFREAKIRVLRDEVLIGQGKFMNSKNAATS